MILGIEITLAIFGILALVRGKLTLGKDKVVVGVPARLLGLLALSPLPLAFMFGFLYALSAAPANAERFAEDNRWTLIAIEAGIVIGIAVLVFAIGAMVAISPEEAERRERGSRHRDDEYDDEDDYRSERDTRDDQNDDRERRAWDR